MELLLSGIFVGFIVAQMIQADKKRKKKE